MTQNSARGLPKWAIVLDVFGTLLVGGGIFFLVSDGDFMGRSAAELRGPAIAMIVVGVMLTAPLIVSIVRRANSTS